MKIKLRLFITLFVLFNFHETAVYSQIGDFGVFNGKTDYVQIENNSLFDISDNLTLQAWVYLCNTDNYKTIISKQWCRGDQFSYHFSVRDGRPEFVWDGDGNCTETNWYRTDHAVVSPGVWTHLTVVKEPQKVTVFVNGEEVSGQLETGTYSGIYIGNAPFRLGVYRGIEGNYGGYWDGKLDEIRVWRKALSTAQIQKNFNKQITIEDTNLIVNFSLEDIDKNGEDLVVPNNSAIAGNLNDGITVGTATTPYFGNEEVKYLTFDGQTQYIEFNDHDLLDTEDSLTILASIYPCTIENYHNIAAKQWCFGDQFSYHFGFRDGYLEFVWDADGNCTNTNYFRSDSPVIELGQWNDVAVIKEPHAVALYVNGKPVAGTLLEGTHSKIKNSASPLRIGVYRNLEGEYTGYFKGHIKNFQLYNKALDENELKNNFLVNVPDTLKSLLISFELEKITETSEKSILDKVVKINDELKGNIFETTALPIISSGCISCNDVVTSSDLEETFKSDFQSVFPNPFNYTINVELKNNYNGQMDFNISDVTGKKVLSSTSYFNKGTTTLELNKLPEGTYILQFISKDQNSSFLLFKTPK